MLGRLLLVIGTVGASTGFMLWGIAGTIIGGQDAMHTIGVWSMIIGVIASVIGAVLYRSNERALEASLRR